MRWSLKLSELDFIIEHRPGSMIGHADALSRHVDAVMHEEGLDKNAFSVNNRRMSSVLSKNPVPTWVSVSSS